jgi:hypothetical protein
MGPTTLGKMVRFAVGDGQSASIYRSLAPDAGAPNGSRLPGGGHGGAGGGSKINWGDFEADPVALSPRLRPLSAAHRVAGASQLLVRRPALYNGGGGWDPLQV